MFLCTPLLISWFWLPFYQDFLYNIHTYIIYFFLYFQTIFTSWTTHSLFYFQVFQTVEFYTPRHSCIEYELIYQSYMNISLFIFLCKCPLAIFLVIDSLSVFVELMIAIDKIALIKSTYIRTNDYCNCFMLGRRCIRLLRVIFYTGNAFKMKVCLWRQLSVNQCSFCIPLEFHTLTRNAIPWSTNINNHKSDMHKQKIAVYLH